MVRIAFVVALAASLGCSSSPNYTPGGGGTNGFDNNTQGTTANATTGGSSGTSSSGTVGGTGTLVGPFAMASGYGWLDPVDGGPPFDRITMELFADRVTCGEAVAPTANHSLVRIDLQGPFLASGMYNQGTNGLGQTVSLEVEVAYSDGGAALYAGGPQSSVTLGRLDSTVVEATGFVALCNLEDGGSLTVNGAQIDVPLCPGLQ